MLTSCAVPGGPQSASSTRAGSREEIRGQPIDALTVREVRGRAWLQRDGRALGLKPGVAVGENQPVQVGARSSLHLELGERAQLELAPNSRLVVHQLPREGRGDVRATWLRLEQGYLRIHWDGAVMDPPMQISFGIWAARLRPGEYFFDTRERVAAACAAEGSMRLSGVPEWTPQGPLNQCLRLEARKRPLAIAMNDAQWSAVRAQRRLHPTLALAARAQSSAAIARLEREQVRSPGPRPAAPEAPAIARAPAAAPGPPVAAVPRTPIPTARPSPPADEATRDRTADELIREAEEDVRKAPRAVAPAPARPPDPVMPPPARSLALAPHPTAPPPATPPPPPTPPPAPEPADEEPPVVVVEPPRAQHTPPVIVIPAEPEPEPAPPPPPPEPAFEEPSIVVVEPPRTQHTPPVIVIPAEPEPEPAPPPAPPPPPPAVAMAPPPMPAPTPRSAPVIEVPAEPEPRTIAPAPAPPPPAAEPTQTPPASSVELAVQSPVVIPPSTQPPPSDSAPRARGATPPSVPLDVAMYSVAAMPDKIGTSESALIVPPTISHEPAKSQWIVNIASYAAPESAQEHARMLVKQKLRAGVREQALPDRMSYLVVIEGFATEEAAETAAIDLEAHFDLDPY